ncbi:MAG TPA: hypothetical protein PLU30_18445 [Verrucomicrobiae bacterium]|nr:hypothetical protein [Verrucomicrobiae bacterium]
MSPLVPLSLWTMAIVASAAPPKAPFKVLFGHDTTCITSCVSPWRPKGGRLTDEQVRASIDEIVGADAILFQPGCGWIPWWKSKVYPAEEHYRFYQERYGIKPNTFGAYMLGGGDLLKTFTARCRERGVAAFVSYRMNDGHGLENAGLTNASAAHTVSRFYLENYQRWRIGPDPKDWNQRVLDWAVPEVRDHKFAFIREICESYDIDGMELDFMRHPSYFRPGFPEAERREIMTAFVGRVREVLDHSSPPGGRRWLCVRLPASVAGQMGLGLDAARLAAAGVDMFNLSCHYFTMQQSDVARVRGLVPGAAIYLEMTHTTGTGPSLGAGYDNFAFRRTTEQQYATTAHLAYGQGADGMSLFNFVYYREHGGAGRGPFNEPPFGILPHLTDRAWLAAQPQWYFVAREWQGAEPIPRACSRKLAAGQSTRFEVDVAPGEGRTKDGALRLMVSGAKPGRQWRVTFNGTALSPTDFVAKPLDHPYDADVGKSGQYACFALPRAAVRTGPNEVEVLLEKGPTANVQYADFVLP